MRADIANKSNDTAHHVFIGIEIIFHCIKEHEHDVVSEFVENKWDRVPLGGLRLTIDYRVVKDL